MSTFAVSEWKAAFKTLLEARPNLSGVTIYDANETLADSDREHIILGDWSSTSSHLTFGTDAENVTITGHIRVIDPASAVNARDRAIVLLKEVKDTIDADGTATSSIWDSMFAGYSAEEGIWSENGRQCVLEFEIDIEAHS